MSLMPLLPKCRNRKARTTRAFRLTPPSLINTAAADIVRKGLNQHLTIGYYHEFGFDPRDVRHTDSPADVIRRALKRARKRPRYRPGNRAAVYADPSVLRNALVLAESRP